jgi:hypothetical protein
MSSYPKIDVEAVGARHARGPPTCISVHTIGSIVPAGAAYSPLCLYSLPNTASTNYAVNIVTLLWKLAARKRCGGGPLQDEPRVTKSGRVHPGRCRCGLFLLNAYIASNLKHPKFVSSTAMFGYEYRVIRECSRKTITLTRSKQILMR